MRWWVVQVDGHSTRRCQKCSNLLSRDLLGCSPPGSVVDDVDLRVVLVLLLVLEDHDVFVRVVGQREDMGFFEEQVLVHDFLGLRSMEGSHSKCVRVCCAVVRSAVKLTVSVVVPSSVSVSLSLSQSFS